MMVPQTKGKALENISPSKLDKNCMYMVSTKYDGNYIQIVKTSANVKFFTSGGKQFYWEDLALEILKKYEGINFVIEGEYIELTNGRLGDRPRAAKLTTYRTNFTHRMPSALGDEKVMIFDVLHMSGPKAKYCCIEGYNAVERYETLLDCFYNKVPGIEVAMQTAMCLDDAISKAKSLVKDGWEGVFAKAEYHVLAPGKRVNSAIKIKYRKTVDLKCIDVEDGEGKYTGMIGSLVLTDSKGRVVRVGAGLSDSDRSLPIDYFIGKIIEIEYEQIIDTYIQPTYIGVRNDKRESD